MTPPLRCDGCGTYADRHWVFDSTRGICTRCAQDLRAIKFTESIGSWPNRNCVSCGCTTYHGYQICAECSDVVMTNLIDSCGPDILDNNPFVFMLEESRMRFNSHMGFEQPNAGWDWINIWVVDSIGEGRLTGWRRVQFTGLYEKMQKVLAI